MIIRLQRNIHEYKMFFKNVSLSGIKEFIVAQGFVNYAQDIKTS